LGEVYQQIGATIAQTAEVAQRTSATLRGGRPGTLLTRLEGVKTVLIAVGQHAGNARDRTEAALAEAHAAGATDSTVDEDGTERSDDEQTFEDLSDEHARNLLSALPIFAGPASKTRGTFVGPDRCEEPLISSEDPETAARAAQVGLAKIISAEVTPRPTRRRSCSADASHARRWCSTGGRVPACSAATHCCHACYLPAQN
jgi:hypothetical protein